MKKLLFFITCLCIFFLSLELVVLFNFKAFNSLSDKLLLRLAMLEYRNKDQVVFIGSSRSLDAVDAPLLSRELGVPTYNISSTGQNKKRFFYTLRKVLEQKQVKTLIIEFSHVNFIKGELGFLTFNKKNEQEANNFEEKIRNFVYKKSSMVKVRKVFKPKTFLRLLMLMTSRVFNHDIWFRSNTLAQLFISTKNHLDYDFDPQILKNPNPQRAENLSVQELLKILEKTNKKIFFLTPPVQASVVHKNCNTQTQKNNQSLPYVLLNYSCTGFPKDLMRDKTHLSPSGRLVFSKSLAEALKSLGAHAF